MATLAYGRSSKTGQKCWVRQLAVSGSPTSFESGCAQLLSASGLTLPRTQYHSWPNDSIQALGGRAKKPRSLLPTFTGKLVFPFLFPIVFSINLIFIEFTVWRSLVRETLSYGKAFVPVSVCNLLSGNGVSTLFEQRTPPSVDFQRGKFTHARSSIFLTPVTLLAVNCGLCLMVVRLAHSANLRSPFLSALTHRNSSP